MVKKCFKCREVKDIEKFYTHSEMKDGHLGKCKECAKKDVHENWQKDVESKREKERIRYKKRRLNKDFILNNYNRMNSWRKENGRGKAHNKVHRKLNNPGICSLCGSTRFIQGHHMDYSKPLNVIWCCSVCHHKFRKQSK